MYIKNYRDLENAYKSLNFFIKMYEECPQLKNMIIDYKKAIREYNSRQQDRYEMNSRIIEDNGMNGITVLTKLPDYINSMEKAEEYFTEELYSRVNRCQYDCTGQVFTVWHSIFKRNDGYIVYHHKAMDI